MQVSSIAFGIALDTVHFTSYLKHAVYSLLQFLASGFIISGSLWYISNNYLKAPVTQHKCVPSFGC